MLLQNCTVICIGTVTQQTNSHLKDYKTTNIQTTLGGQSYYMLREQSSEWF